MGALLARKRCRNLSTIMMSMIAAVLLFPAHCLAQAAAPTDVVNAMLTSFSVPQKREELKPSEKTLENIVYFGLKRCTDTEKYVNEVYDYYSKVDSYLLPDEKAQIKICDQIKTDAQFFTTHLKEFDYIDSKKIRDKVQPYVMEFKREIADYEVVQKSYCDRLPNDKSGKGVESIVGLQAVQNRLKKKWTQLRTDIPKIMKEAHAEFDKEEHSLESALGFKSPKIDSDRQSNKSKKAKAPAPAVKAMNVNLEFGKDGSSSKVK